MERPKDQSLIAFTLKGHKLSLSNGKGKHRNEGDCYYQDGPQHH